MYIVVVQECVFGLVYKVQVFFEGFNLGYYISIFCNRIEILGYWYIRVILFFYFINEIFKIYFYFLRSK